MRGVRHWRFVVGRATIHAGLRMMPRGRVRSELFALFDQWATKVENTVATRQPQLDIKEP